MMVWERFSNPLRSNPAPSVRKTLRDRVHDCPACGLVLDRDENAARNIHDLGWRSAGGASALAAECPRA